MELDAVYVVASVLQAHYQSVVALGRHLEAFGQSLAANHPRMVSPHGDAVRQRAEDVVVAQLRSFCGHAVEHLAEVGKAGPEGLAYGLMAKANAQHGLAPGIRLDCFGHEASLRRYARPGAEYQLVERFELSDGIAVVAHYRHFGPQFVYQVPEVVGKRVVVVNDSYFHFFMFLNVVTSVRPC